MYQGGGSQSVNPAQTLQSGPQGVNPAQLMNGSRNLMSSINPPQMAAAPMYAKANTLTGGANGVSPSALIGTSQNPQTSNMFPPSQMAQLANMGPQDRQKAMLFLQQQHQQRMLQHQQTQPLSHSQQQMAHLPQQQQQQQQQTQQQQQQQQQLQFDRPPSAMSGQPQFMMRPPQSAPPRPSTAMSRPGTSHSHNSSLPRPPSQPSNIQPHLGPQQTFSIPGTPNLSQQPYDGMETPSSPYRGSKRKLSTAGIPPIQTPRMGSQGLPMGLQNMSTGMENQQPMGGPQQQFSGGVGSQHQYNVGARGGGSGVMGGAGGGMMGPPVVPRPNHQLPQVHQQSLQSMPQHQSFDAVMDRNFGGESSPQNMNPFMNGLHQAQMGGANGMTPGPSGGPSASAGLTPAMLAQLQQHHQQTQPGHGPSSSARPTSSGPGAIAPVNQNFGQQLMTDPSRMNALSANAMTNLMGTSAGAMNAANNKMAPGLGVGSQRSVALGPTNPLPFHPSTVAAPPSVPPVPRPGPAPSSTTGSRPVPPSIPNASALNPKVTQVSAVSLATSAKEIPPLTSDEIKNVKEWMRVDREYEDRYKAMEERTSEEVNSIVRKGEWWERDETAAAARNRRDKFAIGLTSARIARRRGIGSRTGIKLPRKIPIEDANRPELLVPVRLELDLEHHKMRDTFVWNLNDAVISPEMFAQSIVEDYNLPSSSQMPITKAIQEQLSDFKAHMPDSLEEEESNVHTSEWGQGEFVDDDVFWWDGWRKRLRNESGSVKKKRRKLGLNTSPTFGYLREAERVLPEPDVPDSDETLMDDLRILIKLDIIVGSIKLEDQFEWDLNNIDGGAPERFAEVYSMELGLGGEFKTAIAHSIREQAQTYQKSLFLIGNPSEGGLVADEDLKTSFLPALTSGVARPTEHVPSFTPLLNYLSDGELERSEKEREKELNRRRRKTTRGRRGVALPDREALKTCRTPAIGFLEVDTSALVNAAISAPTTKRAAAAAASLTIANMVASENGTALMQPSTPMSTPAAIPMQQQKEKKQRGLYKAPPYPPSVLRPRAHVAAPTPSTGLDSSKPPPSTDPAAVIVASATSAPENRAMSKVLSAKKARELEKEAREKEYVDGQHPNWIDGVWHCSNCGCPDGIAIGRRKGPLGDKSQCGTCGKYWHRHRRPRPVEYSSDPEFHRSQKVEPDQSKVAPQKRKKPVSNVADNSDHSIRMQDIDEAEPSEVLQESMEEEDEALEKTENGLKQIPESGSSAPVATLASHIDDERGISPVSSSSSGSEPPLAQKVKMNGSGSAFTPALSSSIPEPSVMHGLDHQHPAASSASAERRPPNLSLTPAVAPDWLKEAILGLQTKYPQDKFEVIIRRKNTGVTPDWRIKCVDCPGKLYTAGPGSTLSNFEVHLKNRQHRSRVNMRVTGGSAPASS